MERGREREAGREAGGRETCRGKHLYYSYGVTTSLL